jgi:hypothetical protein
MKEVGPDGCQVGKRLTRTLAHSAPSECREIAKAKAHPSLRTNMEPVPLSPDCLKLLEKMILKQIKTAQREAST